MKSTLLRLCTVGIAIATICWLAWSLAWRQGVGELKRQSLARATVIASDLNTTLERYRALPWVLAHHPYVEQLVQAPPAPGAVAQANAFMRALADHAHVMAAYLVDAQGVCIAASNAGDAASFVGRSFRYRPYVKDALAGGRGRFFGIGTTSREAGYYLSEPVVVDGRVVGVAVVKIDLDWLQRDDGTGPLAVVDQNDVVVLSTVPAWRYSSLGPLPASAARQIVRTRQYAERDLPALPWRTLEALPDGGRIVAVGNGPTYLEYRQPVDLPGWRLQTMTPLGPARLRAGAAAFLAGCAALTALFIGLYWRQRRQRLRALALSRRRLKAAYAAMEERVRERTAELSATNDRLRTEVAERDRAEQELRDAHEELLKASQLAALGQISAGLTHELNQPLTALRSYSDNTLELFERGRLDAARDNLRAIASLAERMGKITNTLKVFVGRNRQPADCADRANPLDALVEAASLLAPRFAARPGREPVSVTVVVAPGVSVSLDALLARAVDDARQAAPLLACDALRLEHILINLLGNALDAIDAIEPGRAEASGVPAASVPLDPARASEARLHDAGPRRGRIAVSFHVRGAGEATDIAPSSENAPAAPLLPPAALAGHRPSLALSAVARPVPTSDGDYAGSEACGGEAVRAAALAMADMPPAGDGLHADWAEGEGWRAGLAGREAVTIVVDDDGPGIDPAIRDRLFAPFFSTKATGVGMGLGLAIVQALAADCGGHIALMPSRLGGAAFALTLPIAPRPANDEAAQR
ncbi:sensor histidine kinase [Chitinasiproducens palmae]|uniref:C4-dicarboxylate transport sensor protein DctB n=1 Tax=Chitinasiproducens palmae TaxID=1770053 RepID=A0A1H2PLP4_9BURK|nr:ATP-binding protein [Chitinasiproducens palmae]SDV47445.1 histidine kinase [Chitinasiproducens palmae]